MAGERWTFLVLRGEDGPVQQYTLSKRALRLLSGGVGLAVFMVLATGLVLGTDSVARVRAAQLEARNQALESELAGFQDRLRTLEALLDRVALDDAHFRSLAGLEVIDAEVLQAGVGGPGLGIPESSPLWSTDSVTTKSIFATSYDLSALERRALLLSESLEEATDSVMAHRNLFESTPSIFPTKGWLSSRFSQSRMHPVHNRPLPHEGIDISAPAGTPILAAAKGRVIRSGWIIGYGLTVEIDHGYGFTTLYGHASKVIVQVGDEVIRGDVIAQVGSTGVTTASNLHYEVKVNGVAQDPSRFILPDYVRN
ncbi:MAG: M23 family metallopeptidase [Gemmatimonadetes bacterium]|nr:M23 family metallopeptidase [Gemmatimonadota bacterium]MDA1103264.1 M23 family metallopeptidase [Gemmatimonadota bacterium]